MLVAPSILSADFLNLESEINNICNSGADFVHIDVMDGHFVPNLTFGNAILDGVAKVSTKPLDIHLMVENVPFFINLFAHLKPKFLSFHIEEEKHINRCISLIRSHGISPAIVLNPHTPPSDLKYILPDIDMVLLMSVNPGFGGQSFLPSVLEKSRELKEMILIYNPNCLIEVDGGVSDNNIALLKESFVDIVVAGNYIFKSSNYKDAISSLK